MLILAAYGVRVAAVKLLCGKGVDLTLQDNVSIAYPNLVSFRFMYGVLCRMVMMHCTTRSCTWGFQEEGRMRRRLSQSYRRRQNGVG